MTMQQRCEFLIALAAENYFAFHPPAREFQYWTQRVDDFYEACNYEVDFEKL